MINEEIQASPALRTHFEKLLLLKKQVASHKEASGNLIIQAIYNELDKIIKEAVE